LVDFFDVWDLGVFGLGHGGEHRLGGVANLIAIKCVQDRRAETALSSERLISSVVSQINNNYPVEHSSTIIIDFIFFENASFHIVIRIFDYTHDGAVDVINVLMLVISKDKGNTWHLPLKGIHQAHQGPNGRNQVVLLAADHQDGFLLRHESLINSDYILNLQHLQHPVKIERIDKR
jgi:hypothetical protein